MKNNRTLLWHIAPMENTAPLTEMIAIIEDALCYGFEFKIENHHIYYRYAPSTADTFFQKFFN